MMDRVDALRNSKILDALIDLDIKIEGGYGSTQINNLISYYSNACNKYNNENMCAVNATPTEIGSFNRNVWKILSPRVKNLNIIGVTFSNELIETYILFQRKYPWNNRSRLGKQLMETISLMMMEEYYKCKEEMTNKKK